MRLLIPLLCLGFSGVLYATEVPPSHPMSTMSDDELGAVTDHDDTKATIVDHGHIKKGVEENSPHTHGDQESLVNDIFLRADSKLLIPIQTVIPQNIPNKP